MPRIEHVALYADGHPSALKDFYAEAFGLRVVVDNAEGDPPGYFLADDAGFALELIGRPAGQAGVNQRYVCHVCFLVADVAATRRDLEARGLAFEPDTVVANDAMTTAFFRDPEGNRIQVVHRPRPLGS